MYSNESSFLSLCFPMCERASLFLEGAQALSVCPDKSIIQMNVSIEHWWNDTNGKPEVLGEKFVLPTARTMARPTLYTRTHVYKDYVCTSQTTQCASIRKTSQIMVLRNIMALCCNNHTGHIRAKYIYYLDKMQRFGVKKSGGTYTDH
jgi:hypothetical protein